MNLSQCFDKIIISFQFQCGPGTIYDPDTEVCNHPKNTKRSECLISTEAIDAFKKVNNENEIDFRNSQELPPPIKINKPIYAAHNAFKRNDYAVTTVNPLKTTSKTLTLNQKSRTPNQQGDPCLIDGFMGDSENCRKFYRCVGNGRGSFIRYEFSCSETTIWDDEVQSCNHPAAVKRQRCGRGSDDKVDYKTSPDFDAETIQEQTQINYGSKVSQLQVQINNGSAIQNQAQINYGDRTNQSQRQENYGSNSKQNQNQTSKGSAISQSQTQINRGDNVVQSQVQIDHTKQTSQTQTQASESSNDGDTGYNNNSGSESEKPQDTDSNGDGNNNQCTSSGFMGDPEDCKKFYRCVDNGKGGYTRYEFSCGDGTVWDANIEGCNHAWAVKKCSEKAPADSSSKAPETTSAATTVSSTKTPSQPETTTNDDDDDTGYGNQNQNSLSTSSAKPTNSPQYTSTEGYASTDGSTSQNTVCTHNGFIGDASDCKKFYRCVDNGNGGYTKYEFSCGDGTVWDPEIDACNHASAVERCGGADNSDYTKEETTTQKDNNNVTPTTPQQSSTTDTLPENNNGNGQPDETSVPVTTTTERQQTQSTDSSSNNKCKSSGFMGDDNDCKKFYRCVDDGQGSYTRYEFSCGEGTVWDQSIEGCNHAWAVKKCGGSFETQTQPQNPITTVEITTTSSSTSYVDDDQGYKPSTTSTDNTATTQNSEEIETTTKDNECTEEGFFGNSNDCNKFYRCVIDGKGGFIKYEFSCGEGTVWDPEILGCNHPSEENTCNTSGNSNPTTTKPSEPDRENDEINTEATSTATTTTSTTNSTSLTDESQTSSGFCESEGFHPDPNDCKKFHRCVDNGNGGYTKYDFTCGDGTVWDQNIQGCNHESESQNCKNSNTNPQENHETTSQQSQENITEGQQTTLEETSEEYQQTTSASENQGQCTSDGFYANTNDCKKFYRCVSDGKGGYTRYDFACGEGTVWVQEIQACDHDNDVNSCSSQNSSDSASSSTTTQQSNNNDYESQQTTANPSSSTQSQTQADEYPTESTSSSSSTTASSGQCKSEGFYANENDCTKFYRCVDNGNGGYTKYDFACGDGTAWDQNIQACNHKDQVEGCETSSQENPSTQPTQDDGTNTSQSTTPSTTSSGSSSGTTTTTSTSGPCNNDSDSSTGKPSNKDQCTKEGYYGNSQDCTKFYRCVDNGNKGFTKYDFACGEGTIWDQDITACNHPENVNNPSCNEQGQTSDSSSSTTSTSSNQGESSSTTQSSNQATSDTTTQSNNQGASNCSQEDSSKKPGKSQVNCTKAGFYPDPNDCKKFYRCVDWDGNGQRFSVFHFDCGEGTIWDPQLETCNYQDSVYPPRDCSGTQSQSETEETTTEDVTTTEQSSTTDQQTTIQETTTQETTNSESTTSEHPSTTEQTTTQQSTTNEQTTTQQSMSSEQTTTQQSTTNEQTTAEQTTTQQSTTNESTTTEQSTTSQQTTTEQSTVTEQTTTGTEQQTTQQTTTAQSTTDQSTSTEQPTTAEQSSTTEQTTTIEQTTTTQQSTTTEQSPTTEETTTDQQSTTTQSNTDSTTTQESTTQQQETSTTESSTDDQNTTTEESSSKPDKCPETDDDQYTYVCPTGFRRHPKYCNLFYQCTEDDDTHEVKIATFTCPNNTIYDESKTQCVEENKADKKCEGQIAQKRRVKRLDAYTKEPVRLK